MEKIGIVGSGIAGLSLAYLLTEEGYDVHIFEKHEEIGMDAHCVMVETKDDEMYRLNTPPRALNQGYYPNLWTLYKSSGVEVEKWSWAWVVYLVGEYNPILRVDKDNRILGFAIPTYFRIALDTIRLWRDGIYFATVVRKDRYNKKLRNLTLQQYLDHLGVSELYKYQALLPVLSMVCTCSYKGCLEYPAGLVMDFFSRATSYSQYRTKHGTQDAVKHLLKHVKQVCVGASVTRIWQSGDESSPDPENKPCIEYRTKTGAAEKTIVESFDKLVIATQANHALHVLQGMDDEHRKLLKSFKHETSQVVIHRDERVMPENRTQWAPMSMGILKPYHVEEGGSMFTIWMNDSFPFIKGNVFQTWNPVISVDEDKMVEPPITFERPVMTLESLESVTKLDKYQGTNDIYYCGAWNAWRIPLQESAVRSAVRVARRITGKVKLKAGDFTMEDDDEEQDVKEDLFETKIRLSTYLQPALVITLTAAALVAVVTNRKALK